MKVPEALARGFGEEFEALLSRFLFERKGQKNSLLPEPEALKSPRFLGRAIAPHVLKLSDLFNRLDNRPVNYLDASPDRGRSRTGGGKGKPRRSSSAPTAGLEPYWKASSNPENLRLAYFLYFMPAQLFRVASVWAELSRLGFRWTRGEEFRAVEFGAGPASGACGIAAGEHFAPVGLPPSVSWALIEQDLQTLRLGEDWARTYFDSAGHPSWSVRPFHRKLDPRAGLLPRSAPKFHLWLMSYYLNEIDSLTPDELASSLIRDWDKHLEEGGLVVILEPALKAQSRKLLELRKAILAQKEKRKADWLQILLPCLGHQTCGALANPEDWCHEEVTWWRPPMIRKLDQLCGLDRKSLPFSYLVLTKSRRPLEEILPAIGGCPAEKRYRLVSPAHKEGRFLEYYVCGQDGKHRRRSQGSEELGRGDILQS